MVPRHHQVLCVAVLVSVALSVAHAERPRQSGQGQGSAWANIAELLEAVRADTGIPALAAAYVEDGRIVDYATVGVRTFGSEDAVGPDDRFHLGSVTKSITATVVGKLVEEGKLSWGTTVGEALGDVEMRKEYRDATVEQLLQHRGGIPSYTHAKSGGAIQNVKYSGTPSEKRAKFLAIVLKEDPVGVPGQTMQYSNAGYALAGYIAERVTGQSWEALVERHVFGPLAMTTGGFGFPGTSALPDQPRGHAGKGPEFTPVLETHYPPMDIIAPAGNVHCSIRDLARYAIFHLNGLKGEAGYLRAETVKRLHTPPQDATVRTYASGWEIQEAANGEQVHSHGGSAGASYAAIKLFPSNHAGVVVLMNVGPGMGEPVTNRVERAILKRFHPEILSLARAVETKPKAFQFKAAQPGRGTPSFTEGWNSVKADTGEIVVMGEASAQDDARFWGVIQRLSASLNDEDREAYRRQFSERYDQPKAFGRPSDQTFDFMAKMVMSMRGGIEAFHALSRPIRVPDSEYPIRTVHFHLENGYPGYFGIALDKADKIDHFSLFIKHDLCPNGADPKCSKNVKNLEDLTP